MNTVDCVFLFYFTKTPIFSAFSLFAFVAILQRKLVLHYLQDSLTIFKSFKKKI